MHHKSLSSVVVGLALITTGCVSSQDWAEWRAHPTHFASASHLGFSVRQRAEAPSRVTRADVQLARDESWWGKPITVDQSAIVEK